MFICLIQEEFNQHKYHKNNEFFIPPFEYFFVTTFHWYFKRIRVDIGQSSKAFSNFIRTTPRSKVHKVGLEVQANFWNYESSLKLNFGIFDENGNEKSGCEIVAHLKQVLIQYTWNAHSKIEDNTKCIEEVRLKPIAQGIILIPALR